MTSRMAEKSGVPDVLVLSRPPVLRSEQVKALIAAPDCRTRKGKRDKASWPCWWVVACGSGRRPGSRSPTRGGRLRLTSRRRSRGTYATGR